MVVLGHEPIAAFARDHGEVADEAAMLALHTLDSTTLVAEPTFVAPGDSCLRADDPGWRWHCLRGHGTALSDWERRPLAGALGGFAAAGHTHALADVADLTESLAAITTALAGKQAALSNAAVLPRISADPGGPPRWDGGDWPGGGSSGGGSVSPLSLAAIDWSADDGVTDSSGNVPADGAAVARWDDSSGNGIYLSAIAAPTYRADGFAAGVPAVEFDGVDDSMSCAQSTSVLSRACGFEMLAVVARLSTSLETLLLTASWVGGRLDCVVDHSSSIFDYYDYTDHRLMGAVPAFASTAAMVIGYRFDGGRMAISVNGADQLSKVSAENAALRAASATLTLGRHGPWSYAQGNCRLGRLLVWDRALTASARATAVAELRTAFGI